MRAEALCRGGARDTYTAISLNGWAASSKALTVYNDLNDERSRTEAPPPNTCDKRSRVKDSAAAPTPGLRAWCCGRDA